MKNVQISLDEELLAMLDDMAESAQMSRSAAVREALKTWIRHKQVEDFESAWIARLKENQDYERSENDAWLAAESWSEE